MVTLHVHQRHLLGFPGGSVVKKLLALQETRSDPWAGKIPWRRKKTAHSSNLTWEILWTEETGGLQSMGLQRVRPDLVTEYNLLTMHCPLQDTFQTLSLKSFGIAYLLIGLLP